MSIQTINVRHKGQITLPAAIRDELGLREGDRLLVERRGKEIILILPDDVVDPTAGALAKYARGLPPMSPAEMRQVATEAIAAENLATLRRIEQADEDD